MSGYGFYVWTAYGVSFAGIGAAVLWTVIAYRRARIALAAREKAP